MIRVSITKENSNYKKIVISGHAMYADYGKDIVCSAASSIATTTINGILTLNEEGLNFLVNEKGLVIDKIKNDDITQKLLENMVSLLKELEEKYPRNIEIK